MVAERLSDAMTARDIDAFVACFDEEYESEQPVHPDRRWARLYVEPVEQGGAGIDAAVRDMSGDA